MNMPENIHRGSLAALLLGLTWSFLGMCPAQAAAITNLTAAPQMVETSATGKDFKPVTIETGKTYNEPGNLIVHYRNMNVQMGDNQELILLQNGGFRLQTHIVGGQPNAVPPKIPAPNTGPPVKKQPAHSGDGISI